LLRALIDQEGDALTNAIIFCNRKTDVDICAKSMNKYGYQAAPIHGDLDQAQRMKTLDDYREGRLKFLVASDVAARGLDIPSVSHVFNFDVPGHAEDYVHRIGRTARAGKDGIAIAFCAEDERAYLKDIRRNTDAEFERLSLPENFRAVVEGVGPTKPAPKQQRQRVRPKPKGGARKDSREGANEDTAQRKSRPHQKHRSRAGKPRREGGQGAPGQNRGNRRNSRGGQRRSSQT